MARISLSEIEFDNEEVEKTIRNFLKKTEAITKRDKAIVGILSKVVVADIEDHFQKSEGSKGPWQKWSKGYTRFMERIGKQGNNILVFSSRLRLSVKPENVRKVEEGLLWFNNAQTAGGFPYAAAHDTGGPILPKRDFMWLSDKAIDSIEDQMVRFLEE